MLSKKSLYILILLALVGITFGIVRATSNPHSWTNGLVGYWSFDGQYTTSTAGTRDVSNNGNWGAFNGGVDVTEGISGQALSFDGVDDYVEVADPANGSLDFGTNSFTIEAWVKANLNKYIVNKQNANTDNNAGYFIRGVGGTAFLARLSDGAQYITGSDGTSLNIGQWYHVVAVIDRSSNVIRRYVDGMVYGTETSISGLGSISNGEKLQIGRRLDSSDGSETGNWWSGLIDEVRIYNRALSAEEVKQHYDQTRRNFVINNPSGTPPVAWWKMDEATGAQVRDYSVNGNNGTVSNGGYGATSTDGKIGKALNFDGVDDYVDAGNGASLDITGAITIEAWVKPNGANESGYVIAKNSTGGGNSGYSLYWKGDSNQLQLIGAVTSNPLSNAVFIDNNVWVHVAITVNGDAITFYRNGVVAGTVTTDTIPSTAANVYVGNRQNGATTGTYFNGLIDEVRIYNYARTADQIAADYRAGAYRTIVGTSVPSTWWTNGLVGYWNFDGQNTTSTNGTRDTSGNNNWGAFNGGVDVTEGISGQALSFDGVNDFVNSGSNASLKVTNGTIEGWIKDVDTSSYTYFVDFRDGVGGAGYVLFSDSGTTVTASAGTVYVDGVATTVTSRGVWHHIVISGITLSGNGPLYLGRRYNGQDWFEGRMDEVRIYNRALGADEVMEHYLKTRRNLGI